MNRVPNRRYSTAIGFALDCLPEGVRRRLTHVQFACGADPVFAGLHRYTTTTQGHPYSDLAHCVYPIHMDHLPTDRRVTTIVLPDEPSVLTIVHELGHAL